MLETMNKMFPDNKTELSYHTDFQLLCAVILSAQTTDKQVNKVSKTLFQKIKWPQDVIDMGLDSFEQSIRSIWLYRWKAKNIYNLSAILIDKFHGKLPQRFDELITLPWVWEKTAKVVMHVLFGVNVIAVDTHVHRVANRLWFVDTKTAIQTSKLLELLIPDECKWYAHHSMIFFGRYHCMSRSPKCDVCPFISQCKYYKKNH